MRLPTYPTIVLTISEQNGLSPMPILRVTRCGCTELAFLDYDGGRTAETSRATNLRRFAFLDHEWGYAETHLEGFIQ
jgi:hypothetical protein